MTSLSGALRRPSRRGPILIDARAAARSRIGGVERWARELTQRLPVLRPGAYSVVRPPRALAHRAGQVWEQVWLPARAVATRSPLLICPATLAPLASSRNLVVIHDAVALRHPEWYSPAYVAWQRATLPRLASRARAVVTVSEHSRAELAETLGLDPAAIRVVAGGVDDRFTPGADRARAARWAGLSGPYVLTVATPGARKNRGALSAAAKVLAGEGIALVAAGAPRAYVRGAKDVPGLRDLGYVPDEVLPGLYAGAKAFVLTSRHEGFGLPCLEAMASGVPVVASRAGALPETCGDAARLVDPDDPDGFTAALVAACHDGAERERMRLAGLARARARSWDDAARAIDAIALELT